MLASTARTWRDAHSSGEEETEAVRRRSAVRSERLSPATSSADTFTGLCSVLTVTAGPLVRRDGAPRREARGLCPGARAPKPTIRQLSVQRLLLSVAGRSSL